MAKPATVEQYLAGQPKPTQAVLARVRAAIRRALPDAEERISYSIPAYCVHGRVALFFAGWKDHYSLYPVGARMIADLGDAVAPYGLSHKGTIRFALDEKVPTGLIAKIAKYRAREIAEIVSKRAAKKNVKKTSAGKSAKKKKSARR